MTLFRISLGLLLAAAVTSAQAAPPVISAARAPQIRPQALRVVIPNATVKVAVTGSGQGTVGYGMPQQLCGSAKYPQFAACEIVLALGATMEVKAYPDSGTTFAGWQGACTGKGVCKLQGAGGAMKLTALFEKTATQAPPATQPSQPMTYKLSVVTGGEPDLHASVSSAPTGIYCGGNGTEQCWLNFLAGKEVLLVASTDPANPRTVEWIGCTPIGTKTCKVTMDSDKNVAVVFSKP